MNERIKIATKIAAAAISNFNGPVTAKIREDIITESFLFSDLMIARDISDRRAGRDPVYGIPVN